MQCTLANIWHLTSDFFSAKFCVPDFNVVLFDVNRCVYIVFNEFFANNDGIFEIEPIPRHEANKNIATKSQFTFKCSGSVSNYFILLNLLTKLNDGLLILAGSFIQTNIFS